MIPAKKIDIGNGVMNYGERKASPGDKVWWRRTFNWTDDICRCYKHRSDSGNSVRCLELGVIEITDPDSIDERHEQDIGPIHKEFCSDCWHQCRKEVAVQHPDEKRRVEYIRRDTRARLGGDS